MTSSWQFLSGRLKALVHRVRIADPERPDTDAVRIGRECHDRWIHVLHSQSRPSQFQTIREALVLTTVMALVEYPEWLAQIRETCQLLIPEGIDVMTAPLQRQFVFVLDDMKDPSECEWRTLQDLLGNDNYDESFKSDWAQVVHMATSEGIDLHRRRQIPIQLRYEVNWQWTSAQQRQMLRGIIDTIHHVQSMATNKDPLSSSVPIFTIDSIELSLSDMLFAVDTLHELQCVLATGVTVRSLVLPLCPGSTPSDVVYGDLAVAWSQLVAAVCGHEHGSVDGWRVQRVTVTVPHAGSPFLTAFLSSMRHSRCLKFVTIDVQREFIENDCFWPWLAFSLFSLGSTSSVEALHLENFELRHDLDHFARIIASTNPITDLWEVTRQNKIQNQNTSCQVIICEGVEILVATRKDNSIVVRMPYRCMGEVVYDDCVSPLVDVLLPGYGLCSIARESVTIARDSLCLSISKASQSIATRPSDRLRTLVLDAHASSETIDITEDDYRRAESAARAVHLLELVGQQLTGLDLYGEFLDETSVETILQSCSALESLRLSAIRLESMTFLAQYYASGRCQISSLEFYSINIEPGELESFLRLLITSDGEVKCTLKRLRFDEMWVYDLPRSIMFLLSQMMEDPASVEYLHVKLFSYTQMEELITWRQASAHRQTSVVRPLELASRLALISALRMQPANSAAKYLDLFVLRLVFEFAAHRPHRTFIFEYPDE